LAEPALESTVNRREGVEEDVTNELVNWFNTVDATYRS